MAADGAATYHGGDADERVVVADRAVRGAGQRDSGVEVGTGRFHTPRSLLAQRGHEAIAHVVEERRVDQGGYAVSGHQMQRARRWKVSMVDAVAQARSEEH